MNDMKKLMENWRGYEKEVLSELEDPMQHMEQPKSPITGKPMVYGAGIEKAFDPLILVAGVAQDYIEGLRNENPLAAIAAEIALAFTPAGVTVDINDLTLALRTGDGLGVALAAIGFIPVAGDSIKIIGRSLRRALKAGAKLPPGAADDVLGAASDAVADMVKANKKKDDLHFADELAHYGYKEGGTNAKKLKKAMEEWDAAGRVGQPPYISTLNDGSFQLQTRVAKDVSEEVAEASAELAEAGIDASDEVIEKGLTAACKRNKVKCGTAIAVGTGVVVATVGGEVGDHLQGKELEKQHAEKVAGEEAAAEAERKQAEEKRKQIDAGPGIVVYPSVACWDTPHGYDPSACDDPSGLPQTRPEIAPAPTPSPAPAPTPPQRQADPNYNPDFDFLDDHQHHHGAVLKESLRRIAREEVIKFFKNREG